MMKKEFEGHYSTSVVRVSWSGRESGQKGTTASQV